MQLSALFNKKVLSWALYDWANSAYATAVLAGFFPIFFKSYWASALPATESTFKLGLANSIAGVCIVFLAPVLGAIADAGGIRKRFLLFFTVLGSSMTMGLAIVPYGETTMAMMLFIFASMGFLGSMVFYDALIVAVVDEDGYDLASAFGYALGYLGGGILFAGTVAMTLTPEVFGLADNAQAVKFSFFIVGIWWVIFAIPLMKNVPEDRVAHSKSVAEVVLAALVQLKNTFSDIKKLKYVFLFLIAYWLYIDGVDTIIVMAVDYGVALGFPQDSLIIALLITQFVGFPAALLFGVLGQKFSAKRAILFALFVYVLVTIFAFWMDNVSEFYTLAIVIGLVQGGIQSMSRSLYASMIPTDKSAEFFGFYNMVGKFAAIIGPTLVGTVALLSGSSRVGILSISSLLLLGGVILLFVNVEKGKQAGKSI